MTAYYPLEALEPQKLEPKMVPNQELVKQVGSEESELNYIVMAFIVGVVALAISDVIRA